MKLEVLARRIGWMRNGEMAADPALSRLPPSLSTVRLHCRRSATLSHRTSSLHIISHFNVDHYPRIHFVLNPLMMQDAQSLSPFEEQQSFSKLKSFDEVSHKLWGRHWRRMPMQHKSKTLQNLREITLLVSVAGSWACCPGHGHGPRVSNVAKGRYRVARAAKSSQHWQLRLV